MPARICATFGKPADFFVLYAQHSIGGPSQSDFSLIAGASNH